MRDFVSLRDAVDRLLAESFVNPDRIFSWATGASRAMPLEIYETPEDVVVRALLPGVSAEDLDVNYQQGMLTLRAKTEAPAAHDDWTWHAREFGYGETTRTVALPREVDADRSEATLQDGLLTLRLPKAEAARPKLIRITPRAAIGAGGGSGS